MNLALWLRFARRDLRSGLQGFWIFLTCLALGTGTIALGSSTTLNVNKNLTYSNTFTGSGTIVNTGTGTVTGDFTGFSGTFTHNSPFVSVAFNNANATSASAAYHIASAQGSTQGMIAGGNGDYTLKLGALSGVANSLFRGGNVATGSTTLENRSACHQHRVRR